MLDVKLSELTIDSELVMKKWSLLYNLCVQVKRNDFL